MSERISIVEELPNTNPSSFRPTNAFIQLLVNGGVDFASSSEEGDVESPEDYDSRNQSTPLYSLEGYKVKSAQQFRKFINEKLAQSLYLHNEFVEGFTVFISDEKEFMRSMRPMLNLESTENVNSLVKILLNVECIQSPLIQAIAEKIPEYGQDGGDWDIVRLILSQLRWMDFVKDTTGLTTLLLQIMESFESSELKCEIINIIPEVIGDDDHHIVVDSLSGPLRMDVSLTVPILETFSNIGLPSELLEQVTQLVLTKLNSSKSEDLPAVVRFLIQSIHDGNMTHVLNTLRRTLNFDTFVDVSPNTPSAGPHSSSSAPTVRFSQSETFPTSIKTAQSQKGDIEALTIDALVQGLRFREDITSHFLKLLSSTTNKKEHYVLDLLFLFGMHSLPKYSKPIESLLKKKVSSALLTSELLEKTIMNHSGCVRAYFESLKRIAHLFVSHSDPNGYCRKFGSLLYRVLYLEFQDAYSRQELVSSLLIHTGSSRPQEVDAGLNTLVFLAKEEEMKEVDLLHPYAAYLNQLLDCIENLTDSQCRQVYFILCRVCTSAKNRARNRQCAQMEEKSAYDDEYHPFAGSQDLDQLNLVLKKQLSHPEKQYRHFGIIGSIAVLAKVTSTYLLGEEDTSMDSSPGFGISNTPPNSSTFQWMDKMLDDLLDSCKKDGSSQAFLFHELTKAVNDGVIKSKDLITKIVSNCMPFLNQFLASYDPRRSKSSYQKFLRQKSIKTSIWLELDETAAPSAESYIPIMELVASFDPVDKESLQYLCPLLRLLVACGEDYVNIMACPVMLADELSLEDLDGVSTTIQEIVCLSFLHCVNWFRQLINSFSTIKSRQCQRMVIQRLHDVIKLELRLERELLKDCKEFIPPGRSISNFSVTNSGGKTNALYAAQKKTTLGPSSAKSSKGKAKKVDPRLQMLKDSYLPFTYEMVLLLGHASFHPTEKNLCEIVEVITANLPLVSWLVQELYAQLKLKSEASRSKNPFFASKQNTREVADPFDTFFELVNFYFNNDVFHSLGKFINMCLKASKEHLFEQDEDKEHFTMLVLVFLKIIGLITSSSELRKNRKSLQLVNCIVRVSLSVEEQDNAENLSQVSVSKENHTIYFSQLMAFQEHMCTLEMAVEHIEALESLLLISSEERGGRKASKGIYFTYHDNAEGMESEDEQVYLMNCNDLSRLAHQYLQRDWSNGAVNFRYSSKALPVLIRAFLSFSSLPLDAVQNLTVHGFFAFFENNGRPVDLYPSLNKTTIIYYHRCLLECVVQSTNHLSFGQGQNNPKFLLNYLIQAGLLLKLLVGITRCVQKGPMIANVLKNGRIFIDMILNAMPFFKRNFSAYNREITALFRHIQSTTRQIQILCAHGKRIEDSSFTSLIPAAKKSLELFIYNVKNLAEAHGIMDAYSTGVLKNKNIDGSAINYQEESPSGNEEDSESEDDREDEGEDDEENHCEEDGGDDGESVSSE